MFAAPVSMQAMLYVFLAALTPLPSTAVVRNQLRAQDSAWASNVAGAGERWWPFSVFGGGGSKSEGAYKQKLQNIGDAQYFGEIEIGGQKIKAVIDTGSFELLVFGTNCTICGDAKDLYDSSKSSKSSISNFATSHTFGSGTTYSVHAADKMKIGPFTIDNQSFWEVYDADMFILSEGNFQSIFGVGPPRSAIQLAKADVEEVTEELKEKEKGGEKITKKVQEIAQHYDEILDLMKNVTSVSENLDLVNMSVCLGQESESSGYFIWDDHEAKESSEKFVSVSVNGDYYWSTPLGEVHLAGASVHGDNVSKKLMKVANRSIKLGCATEACSAIIDTGTSLLVAPSSVVDAVYDLADDWEAAGGSCDDLSELPELRFTLDGREFSLPPEAYMGEVNGDAHEDLAKYMPRFMEKQRKKHKHLRSLKKKAKQNAEEVPDEDQDLYDGLGDWTGMCEPLIMSMDADSQSGELWILGMPFFRKYYSSFQFIQTKGKAPKAASMSFSEQDGNCAPGNAPAPFKKTHSQTMAKADSSDSQTTKPRKATLKIDVSRILVPNLLKRAERTMKMSKATRPFVHI